MRMPFVKLGHSHNPVSGVAGGPGGWLRVGVVEGGRLNGGRAAAHGTGRGGVPGVGRKC